MVAGVASSKLTSWTIALCREGEQEVRVRLETLKACSQWCTSSNKVLSPKGSTISPKECYQLGTKCPKTQAHWPHFSFKLLPIRQYDEMVSVHTLHTPRQMSFCHLQAPEAWANCLVFLCSNYKAGKQQHFLQGTVVPRVWIDAFKRSAWVWRKVVYCVGMVG